MSLLASPDTSKVTYSALGRRARTPTIARLMTMALENPKLLSLAAGFTDTQTLPTAMVRETIDRIAARPGLPEFLQYGTNQGRPGLRASLVERLRKWEPTGDWTAEQVFVSNGSQQALYLAMQVLCDPGDIVLVDQPSYFVFLEMLTGLGLQTRALPVDARGKIDAEALARRLDRMGAEGELERLRAVYFVSYFSNPSARSLDETEKSAIATALAERGVVVPVIEDAAYRELYYREPDTTPSVLSLPAWQVFPRLYLATLTKPFATGLKVGFGVCSDADWLGRMLHVKGHHDFGTANFNQAVFEAAIAEGGFDAQLTRIRPVYEGKMRALHGALLAAGLAEAGWRWQEPGGGLYLWLEAPAKLDTGLESAFCRACVEAGVLYVPGELCFGGRQGPRNFVRLSFGVLAESELAEAGRRFAGVAKRFG